MKTANEVLIDKLLNVNNLKSNPTWVNGVEPLPKSFYELQFQLAGAEMRGNEQLVQFLAVTQNYTFPLSKMLKKDSEFAIYLSEFFNVDLEDKEYGPKDVVDLSEELHLAMRSSSREKK